MAGKIKNRYNTADVNAEMNRIEEELTWAYFEAYTHKIKTSRKYIEDIKKRFRMSDGLIGKTFEFENEQ